LREDVAKSLDLVQMLPILDEGLARNHRAYLLGALSYAATQADNAAALTALTGVETRDPTADRRVIEVAMRQPEWVRRHDGVDRAVARGAMADRLPPAILNRTRLGAQLPEWLDLMTAVRSELAHELDELARHPTSRELIDVARLRSLFERWPERSAGADRGVTHEYRAALLRALVISRYLRWFEARAARSQGIGHPPR
jgi:asparagine synthase (glutamine-hydrolysing)